MPYWTESFPGSVSENDGMTKKLLPSSSTAKCSLESIFSEERIRRALDQAGCSAAEEQLRSYRRHLMLLFEWNRKINLTRIRPEDAVTAHLLDSLIPMRWLPSEGRLLDVGSGGGFPGIPIAIARPGLKVTLLEASRKKTSFLKVVLSQLQLPNAQAVQGRVEDLRMGREGYSVITLRALRPEKTFLPFLAALLEDGKGVLAYWSSTPNAVDPMASAFARWNFVPLKAGGYSLPGQSGRRWLLCWRKEGQTE